MRLMFVLVLACCVVAGPVTAGVPQAAERQIYKPGGGVSAPVLVKDVKPQYTADAMRAGVQGVVVLECVVQPDGTIGEARVTKALEPGLDQEAVKAVKQWRFTPGLKDGKPVPVRVSLEMSFRLRDKAAKPAVSSGPAAVPGVGGGASTSEAASIYKAGDGVSAPVVIKEAKPQYTADAMRARIEGTVMLDCVVEVDGSVGDIEVTRSLDPGLDQEAIKTLRRWQFEPGRKDGKPVRVRVSLEMTFSRR